MVRAKHFDKEVYLIKDESNNLDNLEKINSLLSNNGIDCNICYIVMTGDISVSPVIRLNYEELQALLIFSLIKEKESDIYGN